MRCTSGISFICPGGRIHRQSSSIIINHVDHVTDGGSMVLCGFTRDVRPVISQSCAAEDSRSSVGFQVFLECRGPRLQFASSSFSPRARRCRKKKVPDQPTLRTLCSVAKATKPSLDERRGYASEVEAVPQFCRWYAISAYHV